MEMLDLKAAYSAAAFSEDSIPPTLTIPDHIVFDWDGTLTEFSGPIKRFFRV